MVSRRAFLLLRLAQKYLKRNRVRPLKGASYGRSPDTSGCDNCAQSVIMKGGRVVSDATGADLEMALLIPVTTDSS